MVSSGRSYWFMVETAQGKGHSPVQGVRGQRRESRRKTVIMNREREKSILYTFISLVLMRFAIGKKKKIGT